VKRETNKLVKRLRSRNSQADMKTVHITLRTK